MYLIARLLSRYIEITCPTSNGNIYLFIWTGKYHNWMQNKEDILRRFPLCLEKKKSAYLIVLCIIREKDFVDQWKFTKQTFFERILVKNIYLFRKRRLI